MLAGARMLLERERELEAIRGVLADARACEGRVVVVEGEPGIGKTALLEAASVLGADAGFYVLRARGAELEGEFAFGVARQLFEPVLRRLSKAAYREVMADAAALSERALGLSGVDGGEAPPLAAGLHGLYWLCANLAERGPVLLTVDDAQWSDLPSLRWLGYLARRLDGLAVAVAVATRLGVVEPIASVIDDVRRERDARVLTPAPLTEDGLTALIEERFGVTVDVDLARAVHAQSSGNPLIAHELARSLAADGDGVDAATAERVLSDPPQAALRAVLVRLGRLPAEAAALARALAVLETDVRLSDAAALAELGVAAAAEAADALVAAGIVVAEPALRFVHPLLRAAVYGDIPPARRGGDHGRAAALLRRDPAARERVTAHLLACEPTGEAWVIDHLRVVGRAAMARGAPEIAASLLERCLAERPASEVRARVLHELGAAERRFAPWSAIPRLEEAYETTIDPRERIAVARELAIAMGLSARVRDAYDLLERTLGEVPEDDRELALAIEAELLAMGMVGPGVAERVNERVASLPTLSGETAGERLVLANVARYRNLTAAPAAETADIAERAIAGGRLLADQTPDSGVFVLAVAPLLPAGRLDVARAAIDQAIADASKRGSLIGLAMSQATLATIEFFRGGLALAEGEAQVALELGRQIAFPPVVTSAVRVLVEVAIECGQLDTADALLADNHLAGPIPHAFVFFNFALYARGCLRLAQGRTELGIADLLELGERERAAGQIGPTPWRAAVAPALAARGDPDEGSRLAAEELEIARRRGGAAQLGIALRAVAQVQRGDASVEHLAEAARILEPTPFRLHYAHALADLGAELRRSNQRAKARDPLLKALDLAHRCGAEMLAERARQELLATGARPRKLVLSGVDALTPSERRVAGLAAEGMTNKQIAQTLFVTHRTIGTHLERTYAKLGIATRTELAAALALDPP